VEEVAGVEGHAGILTHWAREGFGDWVIG
jgi:hypothetical protein